MSRDSVFKQRVVLVNISAVLLTYSVKVFSFSCLFTIALNVALFFYRDRSRFLLTSVTEADPALKEAFN